MIEITYGSLFSGAGGFELGLDSLGWECQWQCEKDSFAQQVLKYHWPDVELHEDIFKLDGELLRPVEVVVGGFPCQSFSVAGAKDGSGLEIFDQFVRIVKEIREASGGIYPRAVIWENVPGITSRTRDWMSYIYSAWGEIGAMVQEHRTIDAQFFGVPQRRRRVIGIVSFDPSAGSRGEILFDSQSVSGDFGEGGEERQDFAPRAIRSAYSGGLPTVINSWFKGPSNTQVETGHVIAFDRTQITNKDNRSNPKSGDPCHPLAASAKPPHIVTELSVRRLTPLECERLMGWPDEHTLRRVDGKLTSDTQRYKMCGNGLVAPVASWAGARLERVL